jgi:hypothetical protein
MLASLLLTFRLLVTAAAAPAPAEQVRTAVADGSVWADVCEGGQIVASYRLRDADERTRWIVLDVDGDGHSDVVAIALDGGLRPHVEIWRAAGPDGFQPMALEVIDGRVARADRI